LVNFVQEDDKRRNTDLIKVGAVRGLMKAPSARANK
jgi:hypothetical protein